jgi:NNP family nitrate/nitrite transporter-like MFS transporter
LANISFFFPKSRKGYTTGMNAGIGNLDVSVVQFVAQLVCVEKNFKNSQSASIYKGALQLLI